MPPASLFRFIWHYARPMAPLLALICVGATVFAVLEVVLFGYFGDLIDRLTGSDPARFWADHWGWIVTVGVLALVVLPLLDLGIELLTNQSIMSNMPMRIRWLAHRYLLRQSMRFYQDEFAGRIATKMMQSALAVRDVITTATLVFVYIGVYVVSAFVLFAQADWRLMLPMLVWVAVYGATMGYFLPRMQAVSKAQADARSQLTGRVVDAYTNIQTVKLFAHAEREEAYAKAAMTDFMATAYPQFRLVTRLNLTLELMNGALLVAVALVGIWLWTGLAVTAGAVAFSLGLILRLKGMSHWVLWEVARVFENIGTVQDGLETLARDRDLKDAPGAPALAVRQGGIRFDQVAFHYGRTRGVLEDVSLTIEPGERIGLVGPSGAGKSTMVNLLLRFYDPEAGRVRIDGQDIRGVTQTSVRAAIGLVSQDTSLLHRSVRDNIRYGRQEATDAAVLAAVEAARVDGFLGDLCDAHGRVGLDAHVGERGVKLSGGQRQRIAIARVILKDAPILVLDEATAALDSEVEAAIQESLARLMGGKTVIAIAHRLSTIAAMDRLVIMDRGRIVEQGPHDALLRADGLYARLWARQSGGFIDQPAARSA